MADILIPLPDTDFDVTEVAVPWRLLTRAGHRVVFATEHGAVAACDPLLLAGVLFGQLGAEAEPKRFYGELLASPEFLRPITWADCEPGAFGAMVLPGGHAPGMKQYLSSRTLQDKVALFARTNRPLAAICHGVLVVARAVDPETGRSVLHGRRTTCLPSYMERTAYYLTAWRHGRYYRTYDAYVQEEVVAALAKPSDFERGPFHLMSRGTDSEDGPAFVCEDGNYISSRWPGDAYLFTKKLLAKL
jgi:putative intracellular protease/amidase